MRAKDVVGGPWTGRGGPRVLIENADFAVGYSAQSLLVEDGYDVAVCEGPDHDLRRRCPLVATGSCDLVARADVVVHSLNPDHPDHAEVLVALRERVPKGRIVVEVPEPSMTRHADLIEGCVVLGFPATSTALKEAVRAAMATTPADARPSGGA